MPPTVVEARHLISPNLHAILVHAPLGLFMFGLFLEIAGLLLFRRSQVRQAARWMLLFGGLMAVPAALSGVDAYHDIAEHAVRTQRVHGVNLKIAGLTDHQYNYLHRHVVYTSLGAGLAAIGVTLGLGWSLRGLNRVVPYTILLLTLIAAATLMGIGAHFGGEGVYIESAAVGLTRGGEPVGTFGWYAPAREVHIAIAGVAMAAALGALGATLRLMSTFTRRDEEEQVERDLAALNPNPNTPQPFGQRRAADDMIVARTLNADVAMKTPRMPAARFWLLSALIFLGALAFGVLFIVNQKHTDTTTKITAHEVVSILKDVSSETDKVSQNKAAFHIVLGIALVVFPIFLAVAARFLARAKWFVTAMCLVMVVLIGAEIWIGVLLSFNGRSGTNPIYQVPHLPKPADTSDTATA